MHKKNLTAVLNVRSSSSSRSVLIVDICGLSSLLSNSLFSSSLEIAFLWMSPPILPVFLRFFTEAPKT